jgi:hypothetical protein
VAVHVAAVAEAVVVAAAGLENRKLRPCFAPPKKYPKNITLITNYLQLFDKIHLSGRPPSRHLSVNVNATINHSLIATYANTIF